MRKALCSALGTDSSSATPPALSCNSECAHSWGKQGRAWPTCLGNISSLKVRCWDCRWFSISIQSMYSSQAVRTKHDLCSWSLRSFPRHVCLSSLSIHQYSACLLFYSICIFPWTVSKLFIFKPHVRSITLSVFFCSLLFAFDVTFCPFCHSSVLIHAFLSSQPEVHPLVGFVHMCVGFWGITMEGATGGLECAGTRGASLLWCAQQPCTLEQYLPKGPRPWCRNPASGWCSPLDAVSFCEELLCWWTLVVLGDHHFDPAVRSTLARLLVHTRTPPGPGRERQLTPSLTITGLAQLFSLPLDPWDGPLAVV